MIGLLCLQNLEPQYFSATNRRPFREAWSSYAPFFDRFGSFTFSRGTFL